MWIQRLRPPPKPGKPVASCEVSTHQAALSAFSCIECDLHILGISMEGDPAMDLSGTKQLSRGPLY